jgi:hypothetical protein
VNLGEARLRILQLTCSNFQHLLKHTILATIAMVTAIQRQHSRGALADSRKSDSLIGFETQKRFRNLVRITIFMIAMLLIRLGSLMICTHNLTILTQKKRKDPLLRIVQIRWQNALDNHFYHSNASQCTRRK